MRKSRLRQMVRQFPQNGIKMLLESPENVRELLQLASTDVLDMLDLQKMKSRGASFVSIYWYTVRESRPNSRVCSGQLRTRSKATETERRLKKWDKQLLTYSRMQDGRRECRQEWKKEWKKAERTKWLDRGNRLCSGYSVGSSGTYRKQQCRRSKAPPASTNWIRGSIGFLQPIRSLKCASAQRSSPRGYRGHTQTKWAAQAVGQAKTEGKATIDRKAARSVSDSTATRGRSQRSQSLAAGNRK